MSADERKQYHITGKGREHLKDSQETLQKVLSRFETRRRIQKDERYIDIHNSMENLKVSLRFKLQNELRPEQLSDIAAQIEQAANNIRQL